MKYQAFLISAVAIVIAFKGDLARSQANSPQSQIPPSSADLVPGKRVTLEDFSNLETCFLEEVANSWQIYRGERSKPEDPYETLQEKARRLEQSLKTAQSRLSAVYSKWESRIVSIPVAPDTVYYDPDKEQAFVELPELSVPYTSGPASVQGLYRGHNYPEIYWATGPLYEHVYLHNTVGRRHYLEGSLTAAVSHNEAKEFDIVKSKGVVECTFKFTYVRLDEVEEWHQPIDFPCAQLLSARWIVGLRSLSFPSRVDTLWTCGKGVGHPGSTFVVAGEPRVIGKSPDVAVCYTFPSQFGFCAGTPTVEQILNRPEPQALLKMQFNGKWKFVFYRPDTEHDMGVGWGAIDVRDTRIYLINQEDDNIVVTHEDLVSHAVLRCPLRRSFLRYKQYRLPDGARLHAGEEFPAGFTSSGDKEGFLTFYLDEEFQHRLTGFTFSDGKKGDEYKLHVVIDSTCNYLIGDGVHESYYLKPVMQTDMMFYGVRID